MKNLLVMPILLLAFLTSNALLTSTANAQGCPYSLLYSDGTTWAYEACVCSSAIGGSCAPTPTLNVVYYSSAVPTGCAMIGTGCGCAVDAGAAGGGGLGGGGGGLGAGAGAATSEPFLVKTNGKVFKAETASVFPGTTVDHYIAKGTVKGAAGAADKDYYFRVVNGQFKNASGQKLYVMQCFQIDPSDIPVKFEAGADPTKTTPADEFVDIHSVKVTLTDDKKHPKSVSIQKSEDGMVYNFNVVTKDKVKSKK
ncbi:MAG: hypothetical protein AB8B55_04010 [Mariniblastus sp.]